MTPKSKSRGAGSGCFFKFLGLIVLGYVLISYIPQCMQELPQMAANTAAGAAHGVTSAAGNAASSAGRSLLDRIKRVFGFARDQWNNSSPAGKFDLVCEHVPVEGVDKLCAYFTSALQGATDAQTARIACYWHAAATGPNPQLTLQKINADCPRYAGDPSTLESCLAKHVEPGDASTCLASSPQRLWAELHTMTEPIACIPGLPKSLCTTGSSPGSATAANQSPPMRTDVNYLNCLQYYYLSPGVKAVLGTSCGTQINVGNESCMAGQLQTFTYAGQNLGQQYVAYCAAQPQ